MCFSNQFRAKAAGAKPSGGMRDEKLHALAVSTSFQVKMRKAHQARSTFEKCMPLWRGANLEVKSVKAEGLRPLLEVQMWLCMVDARDSAVPKLSKT